MMDWRTGMYSADIWREWSKSKLIFINLFIEAQLFQRIKETQNENKINMDHTGKFD